MKRIILVTVIAVMSILKVYATDVGGIISTNSIWTASNSPYIVKSNLLLEPGVELIIEPGVEVKFEQGIGFWVRGTLKALGSEDHWITFTSNNLIPQNNDWKGIVCEGDGPYVADEEGRYISGSIVSYCIIQFADGMLTPNPSYTSAISVLNSSVYFENLIIRNCSNTGFDYRSSNGTNCLINSCEVTNVGRGFHIDNRGKVKILNSNISYTEYGSILSQNDLGYAEIDSCKFSNNNYEAGLLVYQWYSTLNIMNCSIFNNKRTGLLINGYPDNDLDESTKIINSNIYSNDVGIEIVKSAAQDFQINYCSIYGNSTYQVKTVNTSYRNSIDATNNWWGTTNETEIENGIFDYYDDFNLAKISYKPYFSSQNPLFTLATNATDGMVIKNPDLPQYNAGSVVEITANPDPGFSFTGWSGDASGSTNPLTITMDADKSITAVFSMVGTLVTGSITENTTWTANGNPYIITSDLIINPDVTLTIEPGVIIRIENASIISYGKIMAQGFSSNNILFTSNKAEQSPLDWDRILLQGSGAENSEFSHCTIEYGRIGLSFEQCSGKLDSSTIRYCDRAGVTVVDGSPIISDSRIHDNNNSGISLASGSPRVEANLIFNNDDGIVTDYANSNIINNIIYNNNQYGIDNRNATSAGAQATIINNTLDGNGILGTGPFGANINCDNSSPIIKNNIITNSNNNVGSGYGAGIRATSGGAPIISYNNLFGNTGGNYTVYNAGTCSAGIGDISSDPQYINTSLLNYHLSDTSPCLRAATALGAPTRDKEGNSRGNPPDMGAQENISDGDQTLPVQLTSFSASRDASNVYLSWRTETESDNLGFEVYRSTNEEGEFLFIAGYSGFNELKGHGTTSSPNKYHFADTRVISEIGYYYKLKQVDINGTSTFYGPVRVDAFSKAPTPMTYKLLSNSPNPFRNKTTFTFSLAEQDDISIKVFDVLGRLKFEQNLGEIGVGDHRFEFSASSLPVGHYFAVIKGNNSFQRTRITIIR